MDRMSAYTRLVIGCLLGCAALGTRTPAAQVITVSDFQDNTTDGWQVDRAAQHVAPQVVSDGGPKGDSDAFLELTSLGGNGPGSKLAAFNPTADWTGNYLELGATAVEVDMRNDSGRTVNMRLVLFGDGSKNNRWTSSEAFELLSDGQWHHVSFSLAENALFRAAGPATYEDVTSDVLRVMLRHDDGGPSPVGSPIAAKLGLDNIQLVKAIDFNGDGKLDVTDVDLLLTEIKADNHASDFDLNADKLVDGQDLNLLVTSPDNLNTYIGDADLNGEFGTGDLVAVFEAGEYEDAVLMNSTWMTGDWNGDAEFGTGDLVAAFEDGGFELGPRGDTQRVPEPTTGFLSGVILLLLSVGRRRNSRPRPSLVRALRS
jgi:hypothetical protein